MFTEKLVVIQLVNIFLAFYGNQISVSCILSQMHPIHTLDAISLRSV